MRSESTVVSVSWIPSESVSGLLRGGFDTGMAHYDEPPPDHIEGANDVERLRAADRFRFANVLSAWVESDDGRITAHGWGDDAGLVMGSTTVRFTRFGATFRGHRLPVLRRDPDVAEDSVTFTQTVGGRTAVPLPRAVKKAPFMHWQAPIVWTTLALTLHADGRAKVALPGASAFPRHWVFGPDGHLALKSGITDQATWLTSSFGRHTPWGDEDSPALVVAAESELERQLSGEVMSGASKPQIRRVPAGTALVREGDPGDELYLVLDGLLNVESGGRTIAQVGPGAILGELALLEGGRRTATLVAQTPVRVAVAPGHAVDVERLRRLAVMHGREVGTP